MPNHWESSARPLFVRTVFVNGNRHAILFEEDPLLHYGNSPFKKISRSNSSMSFSSELSITSSESQESNSDEKVPKLRNSTQRQRKDLSSQLQSCLIKLRLASGNLVNQNKSDEEKCFCNVKEMEENQKEFPQQRKHKWKRGRNCRRVHCAHVQEKSLENKVTDKRHDQSNSCYIYNYENNKRRKNYCVVKISSQPPQFTLSCRCDGNLSENHRCKGFPSGKNNMLISATVHNLFMTGRNDRKFEGKVDSPFSSENPDSFDFHWNAYLSRSYYNSLSERVFQWLDLASKKKNQKLKLTSTDEGDVLNSTERIFSGKTFVGESLMTENSEKIDNKQRSKSQLKKKENTQNQDNEDKVKVEVAGGPKDQKTKFLSKENSHNSEEKSKGTISNTMKFELNSSSEVTFKHSTSQQINTRSFTKPPLKIQDLLLDYKFREKFDFTLGKRNKRKIRETRESLFSKSHREFRETDSTEEEENLFTKTIIPWDKTIYQKSGKADTSGERTPCQCDESSDVYADKIRNQILSERISETKQKSINNLNFTRGRPVLIQNLMSAQQRNEISAVRTEKIVWGSEKETGRLQLHIFMPPLLLREASEESTSECENFFSL